MTEIWTQVPEWAGIYSVSNFGRVRRDCFGGNGRARAGLILRPISDRKGYRLIVLRQGDRRKRWFVHRLVMLAFCGPSPLGVNHIDSDTTNNMLCNLEYVTQRQNIQHMIAAGRMPRGESRGSAKLTKADVIRMVVLYIDGYGYKRLAKIFHVAPSTVEKIMKGRKWVHVTGRVNVGTSNATRAI